MDITTLNALDRADRQILGIPADTRNPQPIWFRAPREELELFTGMSPGLLYRLGQGGKTETRSVTHEGKERGVRLFRLSSILDFLERCPESDEEVGL